MKSKKDDLFFSILKIITNIVWYSGIGLGMIILFALIIITAFPEYFQNKISFPIELNIKDFNMITLQGNLANNCELDSVTAARITYISKDLYIIRVLLLYYLIIILGICIALFFWRKVLIAFQGSRFFSKENRTIANYFGWLLILYFPLLCLTNQFFKALIDLRISKVSLVFSLYQELSIGIILIVLGFLMLFISRIVEKGMYQ